MSGDDDAASAVRTSRQRYAPFSGPFVTREQLLPALEAAVARRPPVLHICRERDVGLFSLVQQVIANIPWALREGRIPVADFRQRTCYWTARGYRDRNSVWEYYFEPIVASYPAAAVPERVSALIEQSFPDQTRLGYFADEHAYVTNHYGDHESLRGTAPQIPYVTGNPGAALRRQTSEIIRAFVRPRRYIERAVDQFYDEHMRGCEVIGVHVRGTDAVSASETREYRQGSFDLERFGGVVTQLLDVEYLLLARCSHLVHNGASLATTVLLQNPLMPHSNTHCRA